MATSKKKLSQKEKINYCRYWHTDSLDGINDKQKGKWKKCPFCGKNEIDVFQEQEGTGVFFAGCMNCSACGPSGETSKEAITNWEKRYAK